MTIPHVDIHAPEFAQDPAAASAAYASLRAKCPVMRSLLYGKFWLFSRYDDVKAAALDWKTFTSSVPGVTAIPVITPRTEPQLPIELDPPQHSRYRALVNPVFSAARISQLRPRIAVMAAKLIDDILARPAGAVVDLVSAYTLPLSVGTLAEFTNLPAEHAPRWIAWLDAMFDVRDPAAGHRAAAEFGAHIDALIALRRAQPADDFISLLIESQIDSHRLTDAEIHSFLTVTFGAGFETTQDAMSSALHYLAMNPSDCEKLRRHRELIPTAIEELLRHSSPIQIFGRNATRDVTLHGATIAAGDVVALGFGSANLDPEQFPEPERVILDRAPNRHLAFGAGPHTCLGAPVARLELQITLSEFVSRIPAWRLAPNDPPEWKPRGDRRGLRRLPVVIEHPAEQQG